MKIVYIFPCLCVLLGCSGAQFKVTRAPFTADATRQQLDNLECTNFSHTTAPLLYGIGWYISKRVSASRYEECMETKGYLVEED